MASAEIIQNNPRWHVARSAIRHLASPHIGSIQLNCLIKGQLSENVRPVTITASTRVWALKDLFKELYPVRFRDTESSALSLWAISTGMTCEDLDAAVGPDEMAVLHDGIHGVQKMQPLQPLVKYFPGGTNEELIHVIIEIPPEKLKVIGLRTQETRERS